MRGILRGTKREPTARKCGESCAALVVRIRLAPAERVLRTPVQTSRCGSPKPQIYERGLSPIRLGRTTHASSPTRTRKVRSAILISACSSSSRTRLNTPIRSRQRTCSPGFQTRLMLARECVAVRLCRWLALRGSPAGNRRVPVMCTSFKTNVQGNRNEIACVRAKKTPVPTQCRHRRSLRVANPRQRDFAKPDSEVAGERPAELARAVTRIAQQKFRIGLCRRRGSR
jgi:hypothetical protein